MGFPAKFVRWLLVLAGLALWAKSTTDFAAIGSDFNQDYFAAVSWKNGLSIYGTHISLLSQKMSGTSGSENFHPPTSGIFFIPLAFLSFQTAFLVWNILSLGLYWHLVKKSMQRAQVSKTLKAWALAGSLFWFPFVSGICLGQTSVLIATLIGEAFWSHEDKKEWRSGAWLGLAALIKPFPAIIGLLFIFCRRWRSVVSMTTVYMSGCLLSIYLYGFDKFEEYIFVIAGRNIAEYATYPLNFSLLSLWKTLFMVSESNSPVFYSLDTASILTGVSIAFILCLVVRKGIITSRDESSQINLFQCLVCSMLLISPIMWAHMLVILAPVIAYWLRKIELKEANLSPLLIILILTNHPDIDLTNWINSHFSLNKIPLVLYPFLKLNLLAVCITFWHCLVWKRNLLRKQPT